MIAFFQCRLFAVSADGQTKNDEIDSEQKQDWLQTSSKIAVRSGLETGLLFLIL